MAKLVLVIDDEESIRNSLKGALSDEGYRVLTAASGKEGLELTRTKKPDVVLLDIWMEEMDGMEVLQNIKRNQPECVVVMMSGHGSIETAVKSTKLGAYDFIEKPLSLEKLLVTLQNILETQDLVRENRALRKQVKDQNQIVGISPVAKKVRDLIEKVAPTTGSVLITGENGTGKEMVAQSIHSLSPRYNRPFIAVNCAAIPETLIESELFGHEKGAFTGATQLKRGRFDLANGGTIFLDEIGDMSMSTQSKLLRILQEQRFERVGGTQTISVDVRVVAATNKDLKQEIQNGAFREDLFYRLNVVPIHIPPLRERREDITALVDHFMNIFCSIHGKKPREMAPEARRVLMDYAWPGNVRELKNFLERMVILTEEEQQGRLITAAEILSHLNDDAVGMAAETREITERAMARPGARLKDARHEFEREFILKTLKEQGGNVSKTANVLGIERSHLHRKIKSYGIEI